MQAVFPGKPQAKLHAVSTVLWDQRRLVAYISGNALIILGGPNELLQTISHSDDDDLRAVALDPLTGKIATCTNDVVHVYRPFGQDVGDLKWSLQHTLEPSCQDASISALSWGERDELLAAGSSLTLFKTHAESEESWSRTLANPAKQATFSHDASLIATTGWHDRLVKIWQRQYLGEDSERVDATYVPHPGTVTNFQWRGRPDQENHYEYVLYTICVDNKLRVWTATDHHGLQTLQLWTELDLGDCIQLREPLSPSGAVRRYVFVINNWDFKNIVDRAVEQRRGGEREQYTLKHLQEVASESPEVCVILDDRGNMSAWGLERVGCKARQQTDVFNMAHTEGVTLGFLAETAEHEDHLQIYGFINHKGDPSLNILAHHFDGRLGWLNCAVYRFFDPSSEVQPLSVAAMWTGHDSPIDKLTRGADGQVFISIEVDDEFIVWHRLDDGTDASIERRSSSKISNPVQRALLLHDGDYTVFLHEDSVTVWDTRVMNAHKLAETSHNIGDSLWFDVLFSPSEAEGSFLIVIVSKSMKELVLSVKLGDKASVQVLSSFKSSKLSSQSSITSVECPKTNKLIETGSSFRVRDFVLSYDAHGTFRFWDATYTFDDRRLDWKCSRTVTTDMFGAKLICCASDLKIAMVDTDGTTLTIWDGKTGLLEFSKQFRDYEVVDHLEWSSKHSPYPILAVALAHKVHTFSPHRYDYLDETPPWTMMRELDLTPYTTVPIANMTWLSSGELVVAAGLQTFVYNNLIKADSAMISELSMLQGKTVPLSTFHLSTLFNTTLPIFHPRHLSHAVHAGKRNVIPTLKSFDKVLKFYTEGDDLDSFLGKGVESYTSPPHVRLGVQEDQRNADSSQALANGVPKENGFVQGQIRAEDQSQSFDEDFALGLCERIGAQKIPDISTSDQSHLVRIIKSLGAVDKQQGSVDDAGMQYLIALHQRQMWHKDDDKISQRLSWREICWASRSNSQDILLDATSGYYNGKMLWENARDCGVFMWISDNEALKLHFETLARNEYTKTDERNPIDCSLHYLALRKKQVLRGLWRMASWNREQGATMRLLGNDFEDPRWKTAALKNAYALMGRRRTQYAAAFFLLADHLKDACAILSSQLGDLQLAITIARVYEGDDGPVLKDLLLNTVLPKAIEEGNKWLACWAFLMLRRKPLAMEALTAQSRHYLSDDPSLIHFYTYLRDENDPTQRGRRVSLSPKQEHDFVLRSAQLYASMGCDVLALDLVRNFTFSPPQPAAQAPAPITIPSASTSASPNESIKSPRSPDRERQRRRRKSSRKVSMSSLNSATRSPAASGSNPPAGSMPSMLDDYFGNPPSNTVAEAPKPAEQVERKEDTTSPKEETEAEEKTANPAPGTTVDGKPRKKVTEEPSAASILDNFNF